MQILKIIPIVIIVWLLVEALTFIMLKFFDKDLRNAKGEFVICLSIGIDLLMTFDLGV